LPEESALVADARGSISAPRITTAMARGGVRGRVVLGAEKGQAQASTARDRGKGKRRRAEASSSPATTVPARGRARRSSYNTVRGSAHNLQFANKCTA
jgi:hypothetical protein